MKEHEEYEDVPILSGDIANSNGSKARSKANMTIGRQVHLNTTLVESYNLMGMTHVEMGFKRATTESDASFRIGFFPENNQNKTRLPITVTNHRSKSKGLSLKMANILERYGIKSPKENAIELEHEFDESGALIIKVKTDSTGRAMGKQKAQKAPKAATETEAKVESEKPVVKSEPDVSLEKLVTVG